MDRSSLLWYLTVATAVAGGALSLLAPRRGARAGERLYLLSYVLMSLSIALFAVGGLLR